MPAHFLRSLSSCCLGLGLALWWAGSVAGQTVAARGDLPVRRLPPISAPVAAPSRARPPAPSRAAPPLLPQAAAPPVGVLDGGSARQAAPRATATVTPTSGRTFANQNNVQLVPTFAALQNEKPAVPPPESLPRLRIPPGLPGADAPPIQLPPFSPENPRQRSDIIDRFFPRLPSPPAPSPAALGPDGQPLSLDNLLEIARANSPILQQARADVIAARGNAINAGAYPNPQFGFEMDTVNAGKTAGDQGGLMNQVVVTAGKLRLARSAALMQVRNAELAYRRADIDLATSVQAGYYAVLVAQEALRITTALVQFTDETYRVAVELTKGGETAPYEPLQLRVLAVGARAGAVRAYNRYISAWAQLAATMAVPRMPPTQLAGNVEALPPDVCWDLALQRMLQFHTDIGIAENSITRSRLLLRFQEVQPIPDINNYVALQKDFTTAPFGQFSMNLQTYVTLPIFYRNQGGIMNAQGNLMRASQDVIRVRNDLVARLAQVFERYRNGRTVVLMYRDQILPDQARAYRGVFERHQQDPEKIGFGAVVVAQDILATSLTEYIGVLGEQWQAMADLEKVIQTLDLATVSTNCDNGTQPSEQVPMPLPDKKAPPPQPPTVPQGSLNGSGEKSSRRTAPA